MISRRGIIRAGALAGALAAWPPAAQAQQTGGTRRVGVLLPGRAPPARDLDLVQLLDKLGYLEGRHIAYTIRGADGNADRLPQLAREVVAAKPDAIVGSTSLVAVALAAATKDIPIVMAVIGDPIALGLTDSIARPSRNITGFTISSPSIAAKRLELLRELVPAIRKAAYLWAPLGPTGPLFRAEAQLAAERLGIELLSFPLTSESDIAAAFDRIVTESATAVLVESDALIVRYSATIVDECLVHNLPAMHDWSFEVQAGALISYGPPTADNYKGAATYVDRIMRGAKIAELPFEEPTQIKLAINLRTARSLGLSVPPSLLARADEVIE